MVNSNIRWIVCMGPRRLCTFWENMMKRGYVETCSLYYSSEILQRTQLRFEWITHFFPFRIKKCFFSVVTMWIYTANTTRYTDCEGITFGMYWSGRGKETWSIKAGSGGKYCCSRSCGSYWYCQHVIIQEALNSIWFNCRDDALAIHTSFVFVRTSYVCQIHHVLNFNAI